QAHEAPHGGAEVLGPLDRDADRLEAPRRPGLGGRERAGAVLVLVLLVEEGHAASRSPICDCTISAYVGDEASSSWCVPRPTISPSSSTMIRSAEVIVDTRWATITTAA